MRRILTGYAVYFNLKYRRHGVLFQNRYKSIVCQEDSYFQQLVRYIHLNPVRAGIVGDVRSLNTYPYSGHSAVMGKRKRPWQDVDYVLSTFGGTVSEGRRGYLGFLNAGVEEGRRADLTGGGLIRSMGGWEEVKRVRAGSERIKGDERILGDSDFVLSVLGEAEEKFERRYELRRRGYNLRAIEGRIKELMGIDNEKIYSKSRKREAVEARSLFCYWAVQVLGMSNTEVARKLGITQPAVGYAVRRGEKLVMERGMTLS